MNDRIFAGRHDNRGTTASDRESSAVRALAITCSLRAGSFNALVAQSLGHLAPASVSISHCPHVGDLPLYNEDLDTAQPPRAVAALRECIAGADALIWATPEFNHTIPSVTKNVVEWLSHPISKAALVGKTSAIVVATRGRGGYRGMADLARVLRDLGGFVVVAPEVCIQFAHTCMTRGDDGIVRYSDERTETLLRILLRSLERAVRENAGKQAAAPWYAMLDSPYGRGL